MLQIMGVGRGTSRLEVYVGPSAMTILARSQGQEPARIVFHAYPVQLANGLADCMCDRVKSSSGEVTTNTRERVWFIIDKREDEEGDFFDFTLDLRDFEHVYAPRVHGIRLRRQELTAFQQALLHFWTC